MKHPFDDPEQHFEQCKNNQLCDGKDCPFIFESKLQLKLVQYNDQNLAIEVRPHQSENWNQRVVVNSKEQDQKSQSGIQLKS